MSCNCSFIKDKGYEKTVKTFSNPAYAATSRVAALAQQSNLTSIYLRFLLTFKSYTQIHATGEPDGSRPHKTRKMNKLLATCRRASKPIDKIQLTELTSYRKSMQDWSSKKSTPPIHYKTQLHPQKDELTISPISSRSTTPRYPPLRDPPRNPRLHNPHPPVHPMQTLPRPHSRHPRWRSIHRHSLQTHRRRSRRVVIQ